MDFVSVSDLNRDIVDNLYKVPRDIDLVVGVPRSGMLPATLIALYLNKSLSDLDSFIEGKMFSHGTTKNTSVLTEDMKDVKKVLIVEDSSASGVSLRRAKEKLQAIGEDIKLLYMVIYTTRETEPLVDISCRVLPSRIFEWNYMHHNLLQNACVDIDGVLCIDPEPNENDDGSKYRDFIKNAKPKLIPTAKIGWIVTSRLEKYRKDTEEWLKKWDIQYNHLCMMDLGSAEERRKLGNHAAFKASVYKKAKEATWFIESEQEQAMEIARLTGKQVFCVNNAQYQQAGIKLQLIWKGKEIVKKAAVKILPKSLIQKIKAVIYRKT